MGEVFTKLDEALANIDLATSDQDVKTTALAAELASLVERVKADDLAAGELESLLTHASNAAAAVSNNATRISDASAVVAGIEPTPIVIPPVEEIPPIEEPPA